MKRKLLIAILVLFVLSIPAWFVYTRFCLPIYKMDSNTLTYKNETYVMNDTWTDQDDKNLGNTIGIGVGEKRSLGDLIWPFWIIEYKNDKEHNSLYVRGLMDSGGRYSKVSK